MTCRTVSRNTLYLGAIGVGLGVVVTGVRFNFKFIKFIIHKLFN